MRFRFRAVLLLVSVPAVGQQSANISRSELMMSAVVYSFLLLIAAFDWLSGGKVHPVTMWGGAGVILVRETQR